MNVPISIFHSQSRLHPFSGRKVRQAAFRLLESYNIYLYYRNEEEAVICHNILSSSQPVASGIKRNTRYNGEVYLLIRCKCFSRRFLYVISLTGFQVLPACINTKFQLISFDYRQQNCFLPVPFSTKSCVCTSSSNE